MSGAGADDATRPTKRRRSSASSSGGRRDVPPAGPSHSFAGPSAYSGQASSARGTSSTGEDELESDGEAGSTGEWHYTLEVIQQPQRARACGFGDKDRRPLSPPPIIRLWVHTSSGQLVDPTHVSIHYLVLMVDLWSADGSQERNVVMHPNSQPARRRASEQTDYASSSRPNTATSRPATGHGLGMASGPTFSSAWRMAAEPHPAPTSPSTSPLSRIHAGEGQVPPPLPVPGWQDRPGMGRANSYNPGYFDLEPVPPRPVTAPAQHRPRGLPPLNLPSLSTVTTRTAPETGHLTLPAMREARASIASSSSSQHRVSWSTESSRPSLGEALPPPRPSTGSWADRPRTGGGMSSRPSTSGTLLSPRHEHPYASSESSYGFPPTPEATRLQLSPAANYSRVLVGSVTANCLRLKDQQGQTGLFFFTHDLGIRTEGVFALRFKLTNLASLMTASVMPQDRASMLAEVYSEPFTVYSAKRFPGVIPTTDLTRVFANQNVRLPTRKRRARNSPHQSEEEG